MFIDENTINYALGRHAEFRLEAKQYRAFSKFSDNAPNDGNKSRQNIQRIVDQLNNLEIKINGQQEMIRIRIDAR